MNDNSIRVLVEGKVRGKITEYIDEEKDYIKVSVEEINVEIVRDEKLEA